MEKKEVFEYIRHKYETYKYYNNKIYIYANKWFAKCFILDLKIKKTKIVIEVFEMKERAISEYNYNSWKFNIHVREKMRCLITCFWGMMICVDSASDVLGIGWSMRHMHLITWPIFFTRSGTYVGSQKTCLHWATSSPERTPTTWAK